MHWLVFAAFTPIAYAFANITDKILLGSAFRKQSTYFYYINLTFAIYLVTPLFISFGGMAWQHAAFAFASGLMHMLFIHFYMRSVKSGEVSTVVTVLQAYPVLVLILSTAFLSEALTPIQLAAFAVIFIGSAMASVERGFRISQSIAYILIGVVFLAFSALFFKMAMPGSTIWQAQFFSALGHLVVVPSMLMSGALKDIVADFSGLKRGMLLVLSMNFCLGLAAFLSANMAVSLGPLSLVAVLGGLQPCTVFIIALIMSKVNPNILKERDDTMTILKKTISLALIVTGIIMLS